MLVAENLSESESIRVVHIRAFKCLQISKVDRSNWGNAIIHLMKRLAVASKTDIDTIWRQISCILSDLCKVNKGLALQIQGIIGSEWKPGQVFCNLHYTLEIAQGL